jgi:predicted nucleic acid-binding protein
MMSDAVFADSNILVYRSSPASPFHFAAHSAFESLVESGTEIVASSQVVREFIRALHKSRPNSSAQERKQLIGFVQGAFQPIRLLSDNPQVLVRLYQLCSDYPAMLSQVHDANIVATMLEHGVRRILTHNTKHFEPLSSLIEIVPLLPDS